MLQVCLEVYNLVQKLARQLARQYNRLSAIIPGCGNLIFSNQSHFLLVYMYTVAWIRSVIIE